MAPSHHCLPRRHLLTATVLSLVLPTARAANVYPAKPVRLMVPFAAAGPTDVMGRITSQILAEATKQATVVENRPGAGGNLGTDAIAKAAPDGYTLGLSAISSLAIAPSLYPRLPYDVARDLTPITLVGIAKGAIVAHPSAPFSDLKGLVAYARANPGKLNYASSGIGTSNHLAGEYFASLAGIDLQHVPYKGTANAAQDLLSGTVLLSFESSLLTAAPNVESGKLKAIAITSATRSALLPNVPTVAEQGYPGFDVPTWFGLVSPAGLPKEVVGLVHRFVANGLKAPTVRERFAKIGAEPVGDTPNEFTRYIREETIRWGRLIKERGIKAE